jgi:hypothetical protein
MKADMAMEARLDKDQYDENKLVSLTVALDNPYQLERKSFERVSGEINFQGKIFKYVKRRVYDGKLVLLCIPDEHRMVLSNAKSTLSNLLNGLANTSKGSSHSGFQKNLNESDYINQWVNGETCKMESESLEYSTFRSTGFSEPHIATPGKPPQTWA